MNDLNWKISESKRVIKAALEKWYPNIGAAFTGRKDSSVMMHLILHTTSKKVQAMFIDHGMHFDETLENLVRLKKLWGLNVEKVANERLLFKLDNTKKISKKADLVKKLKIKTIEDTIRKNKWRALFTAIRWDEQPARNNEEYFSKRKNHFRVHPMLHWSEKDIWNYIRKYKIPYNKLYDKGFRSIGEKDLTNESKDGSSERSGREKHKEEIMERLRKLGYF